jgi:hypothetical protein
VRRSLGLARLPQHEVALRAFEPHRGLARSLGGLRNRSSNETVGF